MTSNLARPLKSGRFEELARSFSTAAEWAPPGYADWAAIAQQGRQAAFARDIDGVRASCAECHEKYRMAYRRTLHNQPLPLKR
jgi:cytochrome c556